MQSGTHFAKTGGFRLHGARLFHACWGAAPIPAEHKNCVLERWINPSAARFFKSLVGGQLSAAPPLFPVVHSLPPAPYPTPEYGGNTPRALYGAGADGHPEAPDRRPLGACPYRRQCAECSPSKFIGGPLQTVMGYLLGIPASEAKEPSSTFWSSRLSSCL